MFDSKPVKYLGKISYGIYLMHSPILTFFIIAGNYFGGWFNLTAKPLSQVTFFVFYLAVVIGAAHLSYKYFELPIMRRYRPGYMPAAPAQEASVTKSGGLQ